MAKATSPFLSLSQSAQRAARKRYDRDDLIEACKAGIDAGKIAIRIQGDSGYWGRDWEYLSPETARGIFIDFADGPDGSVPDWNPAPNPAAPVSIRLPDEVDEMPPGRRFEINALDLDAWLTVLQSMEAPIVSKSNVGGGRQKWRWDLAMIEACGHAFEEGPVGMLDADLVNHVCDWFIAQYEAAPDEKDVRWRVRLVLARCIKALGQ